MNSLSREDFFKEWSTLHGNAEIRGIVRAWLTISFASARFLEKLRISADGLTLIGVLFSLALLASLYPGQEEAQTSRILFALIFLIIALAADGIDGSVALISGTASRRGAALDAIADRVAESLWAYAFILIGAEPVIVIVAWLVAQIQEYVRARLGGIGVVDIGVVTICERPVRASLLAVGLVVAAILSLLDIGLSDDFLNMSAASWISAVALLWLIFQAIAFVQLSRFAIRSTIGPR
jgi:archaetidylinositol phosphate synthase